MLFVSAIKYRYWIFFLIFFQLCSGLQAVATSNKNQTILKPKSSLKLGLENIDDQIWQKLKNNNQKMRVGLITNHTGKNQQGKRAIDVLRARGLYISHIFVPEHGLDGSALAAQDVQDSIDSKTGITVVSLYSKGTGKKISATKLKDIDMLIFDMQDSGMRHYTYISTLLYVLQAASTYAKPIIVLDRPNPLGARMEGPLVEDQHKSFISVASIPLRHGMTIGELACYFNTQVLEKKAQLYIVPMQHYDRTLGLTIPYTPLSPNLPNKKACYGYSLLGLLGEVRPVDIGLGTPFAMQCLALPRSLKIHDNQWLRLQATLRQQGIESKICDYYSARKKQDCKGLQLSMPHINKAASFQAFLAILKFLHNLEVPLTFSRLFDLAIGTQKVREYIHGNISYAQLMKNVDADLNEFYQIAQSSFLYKPWPVIDIQKNNKINDC
jgi:uncharacterized protein YbbC (DUF1343 family)